MRWFGRRSSRPGTMRTGHGEDFAHLEEFARSRRGVEGFVEPQTSVTAMTLILIAHDGEWTRRRIGGPADARRLGKRLSIPIYDIAAVGYPSRMRDWTRQQRGRGTAAPDGKTA